MNEQCWNCNSYAPEGLLTHSECECCGKCIPEGEEKDAPSGGDLCEGCWTNWDRLGED